jgi:DNA-binding response OmpR family regulator
MKVLIVEDDKQIREFLKPSLEAEYFVVDTAEEGLTGSELARNNTYDLIILDNVLPGKNGYDICKDIRSQGKSTPIIILSVVADTPKKVDLLNCGADDYLTKPFSFEELVARIRALLRRPTEFKAEVLVADDLQLDTAQHSVHRSGQDIYLTRKEFELLEYLMRNQGRVLSRGMIMEHVWDMNADPFSNTIETHILNLRRKIDAGGKSKLIQTLPGRGYRIAAKSKTLA